MGRLNKKTSFSDVFSVGFCLFFVGFSVISFFSLTSASSFADTTASALALVTVSSACTLSAVENTAHVATIPAGTSISEMGQTTFTMVCNDSGGYSIYAIGYGNNELGNTKLLANINGTLAPDYDINTGTNASGTPSSWAMKLTPSTNLTASNILNGYGSYSLVPTTYTKIATLIPSTTIPSSSSLLATYRVNIAHTQPAGNYYGKVRFVMVNPATNVPNEPKTCTANKICYWPNGGDTTPAAQGGVGVPDTMGDQTKNYSDNTSDITSNMDVNLWPSNFKREGYGFAGWSDAYDYVINVGSESNPDAHIYGPMENIHLGDMSSGLSLYAVWVKSAGSLQNWTCPSNSVMPVGTVTALTDLRDNDTYAVAKLADGKCWMIENLRLDYNADFTESLSQGFGKTDDYGDFIGLAQPETANFVGDSSVGGDNAATPANSLYYAGTKEGTAIIDISQTMRASFRMPRYRNDNTNSNSVINQNINTSNMTGVDQNIYGYGNYYNWAAARGTTQYSSIYTTDYKDTSICPFGWRLPSGGNKSNIESQSGSGIYELSLAIIGAAPAYYDNTSTPSWSNTTDYPNEGTNASRAMRTYPNNFLYSGATSGTSINDRGTGGNYNVNNSNYYYNTYNLRISRNSVSATNFSYKSTGVSIRCLAGS